MDDSVKDAVIGSGAVVYLFTPDNLLIAQGVLAITLIVLTVLRIAEIVYKWNKD